jgi:hypothetical protein
VEDVELEGVAVVENVIVVNQDALSVIEPIVQKEICHMI